MPKKRHGNELHPLYSTWLSMTQRCRNVNHSSYKHYGALGIKVEIYLQNFKQFATFMESLPNYENRVKSKLTMDRINGELDYTRTNLRWLDKSGQSINSKKRINSRAKYLGVGLNSTKKAWNSRLCVKGERIFIGAFFTEEAARIARNQYIEAHGLPHKMQSQII